MSIKSDIWIARMAAEKKMIEPFAEHPKRDRVISYGLTSYGYDMRLADEFHLFDDQAAAEIDPKKIGAKSFRTITAGSLLLPPNSFALGRSVEYFRIPRDILTVCTGKSTYARCGLVVNVTPFEPEWEGFVTISLCNTAPLPVKVYAGEGIAQVIFLQADEECQTSYADKKGRYQAQQKITGEKV
jgi:dCTP deaminase